ncbi:Brix domain-containing protein [Aspergillus avenaceus]|uniref:Brix domain-containing protein n=1 Tax=Aspergillus avenaceus TaxID=36643 RepID=A0A5N6U1B8_ASPAV|nr:Brix domain-containing protein [Aspergillus avenaceus]
MAAVYKSVSKKQAKQLARQQESDEEDAEMADLLAEADDTSDSEEDEEDDADSAKKQLAAGFMPKSRVLMLSSRGVTHRHRHLLADLTSLLPHTHKESKLDTKKKTAGYNLLLNSLADLNSCNVIFFLEARKRGQDLYLWLARPPNGPTLKFHVNNLHTMSELNSGFNGNCLKGGRGIVVFDRSFDEQGPVMSQPGNEYRGLVREMLRGVFSVPKRGVKGMKPFVDRIIGIFGVDGKIWIRVYEIRESEAGGKKEDGTKSVPQGKDGQPEVSLVEIGPRFVLTPIVILEGSFGGPVIYENKEYVSPNQVRHDIRVSKAARHAKRRDVQTDRLAKRTNLEMGHGQRKPDALDNRQFHDIRRRCHTFSLATIMAPFLPFGPAPATMPFGLLATELLLHIFRSCDSISDILNLASTCRRLHVVFGGCNKLQIFADIAEREFGPLDEIIQIVTQNASQPAHVIRAAPMTAALLKQAISIGRMAQKWETIYPVKKWKVDYENRRSLTNDEHFRLRRAIYRLWLYHRAFHTRAYDRFSRNLRHVIIERAQLLHNWSTEELAEIEDVRLIISDIVQNHICPSNGTIQRKFRKRYPENNHQLAFNIHLNYPTNTAPESFGFFGRDPNWAEQHYHTAHPGCSESPAKYRSRFRNDYFHDPGSEGWGDEIPHYYVVQDMMKLDPGQVLWLREHASLKEQVEAFVHSMGEWFRDNGETFGDTLEWVLNERGDDIEEFRSAIADREVGIARN